uniref:HOOK domain-containing protein n=1 Tax=Bursaphelenchus xylophilus TaxID=6326 RepID=A0A1I7RZT3_BURXY
MLKPTRIPTMIPRDTSLLSADPPQIVLDQLESAQTQISELRGILLPDTPEITHEIMLTKAARMKEEHKNLQEKVYMLELELANARDTNDLLEFQLVELSSTKNPPICQDKTVETDEYLDDDLEILELEPRLNFDDEFVSRTKTALRGLERLFVLSKEQRETIHCGVSCLGGLEYKLSFAHNQLNMTECELTRLKKSYEEQLADLQRQVDASTETSSLKKKELKNTIEELRDERIVVQKECEELRRLNEEQQLKLDELNKKINESNGFIEELKRDLAEESQSKTDIIKELQESRQNADKWKQQVDVLQDKANKLFVMERNLKNVEDTNTDLEKRFDKELMLRNSLELKNKQLIKELMEAKKEIERLEGEIRPIGTQLERRYEETRYRLAEALKMVEKLESQLSNSNQVIAEIRKSDGNGEKMAREIVQLKRYNDELSAQFNTQMDLISELKKRFLIVSQKTQGKSESNESISWTSKSSSMDDEQYHSEEGGSEKSHQLHHGSI